MARVGDVPQLDCAIASADGQSAPVRANRRVEDVFRADQGPTDRTGVSTVGDIPQSDGAIRGASDQGAPVRAELHRVDCTGGANERCADLSASGYVPQPYCA